MFSISTCQICQICCYMPLQMPHPSTMHIHATTTSPGTSSIPNAHPLTLLQFTFTRFAGDHLYCTSCLVHPRHPSTHLHCLFQHLAQCTTTCLLLSTSRIGHQQPRPLPKPLNPSTLPLHIHNGPSMTSTVPHSPQTPHHVPATFVPEGITQTSQC
jgi:hypothetical protein